MKAGTTTLFNRLGDLAGTELPEVKEPHFFSDDDVFSRGLEWYRSLFPHGDALTGEASTSYSDARNAAVVAERIAAVCPDVKLIYSLRDPFERMRSHYLHQVLRSRETRSFPEAVADTDGEYVARSKYGSVVESYLRSFESGQLLVFRLDDLDDDNGGTWAAILQHIGAGQEPMPADRFNESAQKRQFTPALLWLWEHNLVPSKWVPASMRRVGKRLLTRDAGFRQDLIDSAEGEIPAGARQAIQSDLDRLAAVFPKRPIAWRDL